MTSSYVDRFSCIALAGVSTEYLVFGQAEGGVADVAQLDQLMRALNFSQVGAGHTPRAATHYSGTRTCTAAELFLHFADSVGGQRVQAKTDSQVRWAVLNTVLLLRAHRSAHEALAAAMERGASVAECVRIVEQCLDEKQLNTSAKDTVVDESL